MPPTRCVPPIAIILSRYNESVTTNLRDGAARAYLAAGGQQADLAIIEAAGAFEIPILVQEAAIAQVFRGVVALGCIIRGETDHDRYLADAVTKALLDISLETGVPVGLGVLTVNTVEQAVARSGGPEGTGSGNKGEEAMEAVLATIRGLDALLGASENPDAPGVRFALDGAAQDKAATAGGRRGSRAAPGGVRGPRKTGSR
jgi:6,7-dimethyl-8-ribityllumazine synthase